MYQLLPFCLSIAFSLGQGGFLSAIAWDEIAFSHVASGFDLASNGLSLAGFTGLEGGAISSI